MDNEQADAGRDGHTCLARPVSSVNGEGGETIFPFQLATRRNGDLTRLIAFKSEVWVDTISEGERRFIATWRK